MEKEQKQRIEAYQRVQDFLAAHPLPPPGTYGEPAKLLDEVIARLTSHSTDQAVGSRFRLADKEREITLRGVLREQHIRPIAKIANAVLKGSPGIDKATRMPKPQITTTRLLADARAFRAAGSLYEAVFVKNGRPADFLARFDAVAEELRQSFLGKARNVGKAVGAKEGMNDEIVRGRDAIEVLDAIVTTTFAGNNDVLAKWRSARRVRATAGGGGSSVSAPSTPTLVSGLTDPAEPKVA